MFMDPQPSQQHADLQPIVFQLGQEVTRPEARFLSAYIQGALTCQCVLVICETSSFDGDLMSHLNLLNYLTSVWYSV